MQKLLIFWLALFVCSCSTTNKIDYSTTFDEELLDTLTVTAPVYVPGEEDAYARPVYNPAAERVIDILHTKLQLSFDWDQEAVIGMASVTLSPLFYPAQYVTLHAQYFDIEHIHKDGSSEELAYVYDDQALTIDLERIYSKTEQVTLHIKYVAHPGEGPVGGSDAITSDKGLFFINPDGTNGSKPRQIWTQGETEHNSKWFPTFDKPNERFTQEIILTVADSLETLSNGLLVSTKSNGDGTKTDHWKLDEPHAPYLAMVAVGDFARVADTWSGIPLEYLVDPPYEDHAKAIFDHTPEMLTFFSDLLDYPYPWAKYSQVVVEDFVSGAMENTTAVTFGDFVQKTTRELIDNGNDKIVAHEMFHHWFGDLVTCESWANLTLNEGFANYSEYLWYEHKYGRDAADHHRAEELGTYLFMASQAGTHPLIHYGYADKEDMFDVHSYNKGGLVLHMLRHYVGDAAFFASLNYYLNEHKYTAVEVDELRMAYEDVTGKDLQWFFDQWYLDQGHPILQVSDEYDLTENVITVHVEQVQDPEEHLAVFELPLEIAVIGQGDKLTYHKDTLTQRSQSITIKYDSKPKAVLLDGKGYTLAEVVHERSDEAHAAIIKNSQYWTHKMESVMALAGTPALAELAQQLMKEQHYSLRIKGIEAATVEDDYRVVRDLSVMDSHSEVQAAALQKYAERYPEPAQVVAKRILSQADGAYPPLKAALNVLYNNDKEAAIYYAEQLAEDPAITLVTVLADLLAETGDAKYMPYLERSLDKVDVYQVFNVYGAYSKLLQQQDAQIMYDSAIKLSYLGQHSANMYKRYMATKTIHDVKQKLIAMDVADSEVSLAKQVKELDSILHEIIANEKSEELLSRYEGY